METTKESKTVLFKVDRFVLIGGLLLLSKRTAGKNRYEFVPSYIEYFNTI